MPDAGDSLEPQLVALANAGVDQIVSLLEHNEANTLGLSDEAWLAKKHGMEYVSFPLPDMQLPPSLTSYVQFTALLAEQIRTGTNTLIHCRAGIGRTGMISAGILIHSGLQANAAFDLICEKRGVSVPDTEKQRDWVVSNYRAIVQGV